MQKFSCNRYRLANMSLSENDPLASELWFKASLLIACLLNAAVVTASDYCAQIQFPSLLSNLTVVAQDHSNVTLQFYFVISNLTGCDKKQTFLLVSRVTNDTSHTHQDYCILLFEKLKCKSFHEAWCRCEPGDWKSATFNKKMEMADRGSWVWWTRDDSAPRTVLTFDIRAVAGLATATESDEDNHYSEVTETYQRGAPTTASDEDNHNSTIGRQFDKLDEDNAEGRREGGNTIDITHIAAIVAGVNVATVIIIVVVSLAIRTIYKRRGTPLCCSLHSFRRRRDDGNATYYCHSADNLSVSSRIYEEIKPIPRNQSQDTNPYLSPILPDSPQLGH